MKELTVDSYMEGMNEQKIIAYTDGSALANGKKNSACGWAYKLIWNGIEKIASGGTTGETNNRMEMTAVLQAMRAIKNKNFPTEIYSDSAYLVETMNGKYAMKKNTDLWDKLITERKKFRDIKFFWVKGHEKDQHNIEVDRAANAEAEKRKG